jgi:hypothetical protein
VTRDLPWLLIAFPICALLFAALEGYALCHPDRYNTLSRLCYDTGRRYPISLYLAGMFTGILIVHLFARLAANAAGLGNIRNRRRIRPGILDRHEASKNE